jgi:hypothetical protein
VGKLESNAGDLFRILQFLSDSQLDPLHSRNGKWYHSARLDDPRPTHDLKRDRMEENQDHTRPQTELDIEWQKLELDKQRLQLEKAKEGTTKLQIVLPLVVSVVALLFGPLTSSYQGSLARVSQREQEEHQAKQELFKKLTEHTSDPKEIERVFETIFADDDRESSQFLRSLKESTASPATAAPSSSR